MSWEYVTLDKLGSITRGRSKHRPRNASELFGGKYPFIQTADVKSANFYITEYTNTYNDKGLAQSKLWPKNTLCITIAANIADTAILGIEACFPDSIMGFIPYEKVSDVRFVKYCFDILQRNCKQISQGTAQDNLSWEKLSTIKFPMPKYEEQVRIAKILSSYDDLIENNQKQIKLLEEAAQRLYKEWFVDFRFPGHENTTFVDGLPEGWKKEKLFNLGNIITGKTPSTKNRAYFGGNIPFVKIPDMHNKIFPLKTEMTLTQEGAQSQKNKYLPPDSLLVSCIATVGLVNITSEYCQTNQQINSLIPNDPNNLYYLFFFLKNIKALLEGIGSNGATMTNVNKDKFGELPILMPSSILLKDYNNFCKPLFKKILNLSIDTNALTEARDRLLPKLMSGEIEV